MLNLMSKSKSPPQTPFQWIPGHGPDPEALARLKSRFARPTQAMGEAWFMGEQRTIYDWLLEEDAVERPIEDLQAVLEEIASGLTNFGHADVWAEWYGYLLPRCIPRAFESYVEYLIEHLVTGFMAVMPDSSEPWGYPSFREDALPTLGQAVMAPEHWPDGPRASVRCLHSVATVPTGYPIWADASGDFSASMFFCLKYLAANDVLEWTKSVFEISCPRWRAQLMVWLCGAKGIVDGKISHPAGLERSEGPRVNWAWCHLISGENAAYGGRMEHPGGPIEFLPAANRRLFDETVMSILNERMLSEWLESLMEFEHLFDQVTGTAVPERLRQLYGF